MRVIFWLRSFVSDYLCHFVNQKQKEASNEIRLEGEAGDTRVKRADVNRFIAYVALGFPNCL
jgi:hypothetical protein